VPQRLALFRQAGVWQGGRGRAGLAGGEGRGGCWLVQGLGTWVCRERREQTNRIINRPPPTDNR
jgi:hypothetical protein